MDIVARVSEPQSVTPTLMDRKGRLHGLHRKGFVIEGPYVESAKLGVVLDNSNVERLVR